MMYYKLKDSFINERKRDWVDIIVLYFKNKFKIRIVNGDIFIDEPYEIRYMHLLPSMIEPYYKFKDTNI